jgi:hypothetical protein
MQSENSENVSFRYRIILLFVKSTTSVGIAKSTICNEMMSTVMY